jgi:hypothetical protein
LKAVHVHEHVHVNAHVFQLQIVLETSLSPMDDSAIVYMHVFVCVDVLVLVDGSKIESASPPETNRLRAH